jgi:hypothetical protein
MEPSTTKEAFQPAASAPLPSAPSAPSPIPVGLDLGHRQSRICVLDAGSRPDEQCQVAMSPKDLTTFFVRIPLAHLVLRSPIPSLKSKLGREHDPQLTSTPLADPARVG